MNDGVYIYTCNVQSVEYNCWKKHSLVYDSHYKPFHQNKCCGVLIDNRAYAPIFVLEEKDRESKKQLDHALKEFFGGKYHVVVVVVCYRSPGRKACPNYEAVWARTGLLL